MDDSDLASELRIAVTDLLKILDDEGETNWRRGVWSVLAELTPPFSSDAELHVCLVRAISIWHTMYAGNGSFSDWFVWREDADERKTANIDFDRVIRRIQVLIDSFQR